MGLFIVCDVAQVQVDVPDQKGRLEILKVHARNKKLDSEVELLEVALRTPGGCQMSAGAHACSRLSAGAHAS